MCCSLLVQARQQSTDQTIFTTQFARFLAAVEEAATHSRTGLVGDLNMNPYENGVVTTTGLKETATLLPILFRLHI